MGEVLRRLEMICAEMQAMKLGKELGVASSPNVLVGTLLNAAKEFASRIGDAKSRTKLQELRQKVGALLGDEAIAEVKGVYNSPRLYRFLLSNQMDVVDATSKVALNSKARVDLGVDAKRERIVGEDLSLTSIPRAAEFRKYVPSNPFVGRAKDGRFVDYYCLGAAVDVEGLRAAFSTKEGTELLLYTIELSHILLDAAGAIEGRTLSYVTFYDCSNFSLDTLFTLMSCESSRLLYLFLFLSSYSFLYFLSSFLSPYIYTHMYIPSSLSLSRYRCTSCSNGPETCGASVPR